MDVDDALGAAHEVIAVKIDDIDDVDKAEEADSEKEIVDEARARVGGSCTKTSPPRPRARQSVGSISSMVSSSGSSKIARPIE